MSVNWGKWFGWLRRPNRMRLSWATRVTLLRVFLLLPFVACMLHVNDPTFSERVRTLFRYVAVGLFACMAIGDALDGYLARHYQQITKLGTFLDPVADKLLITSACLLLVSQRGHVGDFPLPLTVVVLIIGKDLLIVLGFVIVYMVTGQIYVVPTTPGKASTVLQCIMVGAVLIAPEMAAVVPHYRLGLSMVWWSAGAAAILATLVYIWAGSRYIERFEQAQADASSDGQAENV